MKFNDDITNSIAATVKDVLEGKAVKKEEVKYPHKMYHPETGEEVEVQDKAGHDKYNKLGYVHEKPKVNEVEEPRAKGEKDFKDKHVVKKSGEKEDGTVVKEETDINEAVNHTFGFDSKDKLAKFKSQAKGLKSVGSPTVMKHGPKEFYVVMFKGSPKDIEKATKIAMTINKESVSFKEEVDEESEKQKKYQAFFNKALKKFGVKSPSELEGDKKKEFFDYVDKNYEADKESD